MSAGGRKILAVIPCRYDSTRLPGKPLADICGKTMIERVYEAVSSADGIDRVVVAADDERIADAVTAFAGQVMMTSRDHKNGTSRVAEVASRIECDYVLNVQGDEPLLDARSLGELAGALSSGGVLSATLCCEISDPAQIDSTAVVKVVRAQNGDALYFSRSRIPFPRVSGSAKVYSHIGVYGFERGFLDTVAALPQTPLAEAESLEQLKILESGYAMRVVETAYPPRGPSVDTPEDLAIVRKIFSRMV